MGRACGACWSFRVTSGAEVSVRTRQAGISLVELLVAIVVGLLVVASVLVTYLSATQNFSQDQRYVEMIENARYAMKALTEDLLLADFWGPVTSPDTVVSGLAAPDGSCGAAIDLFSTDGALMVNGDSVAHFAPCDAVTEGRQVGTQVLAVKHVAGAPGATSGTRLRSAGVSGLLVDSGAADTSIGERDWAYQARLYFVRAFAGEVGDGIPTLCRMNTDGNDLGDAVRLADGIEDLQLQFGVDDDGDGVPNRYLSAPTLVEMGRAVSARVFLLARSITPDPQYQDTKAYQLGDKLVDAVNDGHYRRVFTTTVALRNLSHRLAMNSE